MKKNTATTTQPTVRERATRRALDKAALEQTTGAASCTACGHLSALDSLADELR